MQNKLYLVAGCNGAGKTTAAFHIFPELLDCREYVNADAIAAALSPFHPGSVAFEAGRIMLKRIEELLDKRLDFAIETTLSSKNYVTLIEKARARNYSITLLFLWLSSPEMAVDRVQSRVEKGGHHIPPDVVHRRYKRGISNLYRLYIHRCDTVFIYDSTHSRHELLATNKDRSHLELLNPLKINIMKNQLKEQPAFYMDSHMKKIDDAMKIHYRLLIEETIRDNSYLVVGDKNGKSMRVYADELKRQLDAGLIGQL